MFSKTRKSKLLGEIMREKVSSSLVPNTCLLHLKNRISKGHCQNISELYRLFMCVKSLWVEQVTRNIN